MHQLFCVLFIFQTVTLYGQNARIDSLKEILSTETIEAERIEINQRIFGAYVYNAPDSALTYALISFEMSKAFGVDSIHGQSIMDLTHAYFVNNKLDSAKSLLLRSIPFYERIEDYFMVAASYRNLAVIGEGNEQPDTSLKYLEKCLEVLEVHPDSTLLGDVYLSQGFAYRTKGFYELSIESLLKSLRIFEVIGNINRKGYAAQNLGLTLGLAGRTEEAARRMNESVAYFLAYENKRGAAQSLNNIGSYYRELEEYNKAVAAHIESINLAHETEQSTVVIDNVLNLSKLYRTMGRWDSVAYWTSYASPIAKQDEDDFALGAIARYEARVKISQGNRTAALNHANRAEELLTAYIDPQEQEEAYLELSEIYEIVGNESKALSYWKKAEIIQDSFFTIQQDQQIEELNLIYKTEKKDTEIQLLNKQRELDTLRKRTLWIALGLLALLALSTIYSLIQRKRKKEAILIQQREAQTKKLELASQELEFKKKELTSKTLQLARKNEFLISLESEIENLKSSVDMTVGKTSERISRMIQMDANDEDEWEQFGREFSSVHQDFLDRLKDKYGSFSKGEMRLIALLKMNMSSKEIASTLRISGEGIKKARYRLRKKMEFDSEVDIQSFLIGF